MTPLVSIRDLRHTYLADSPLATTALRGADLTIEAGEIAALVGPSGAGKSTLVHFIDGLLRPEALGHVNVLGCDTGAPDADLARLRQRVGLVFQSPHHQLLERYVGDDIAYGPRRLGLARAQVRERVAWAMGAVGLDFERFVDRHTYALSGGEMRRVALAGVLAVRPELLILDEATTGLDPRGRVEIHALLRELNRREGMAILIVSNDMDEVAALAGQVTVLHQGRTAAAGPTRQIFAQPELLSRCGLALPRAAQIMAALRARGLALPDEALTLEGAEEALWRAMTR
ncbi:MAG: energy-coupling factor transporter ATPase [Anaerolineae bacterium]|nr:energy-coupling factor transporter ATPase [Anaerolineae bacterium]